MLSKMTLLVIFVGVVCCVDIHAQLPPPGAGDRNIGNRDIKDRSIELERIKRDAEKPDDKNKASSKPAINFQQVKEDFENIQRMQDGIVNAYSKSKEIDYKQISTDAAQMNQSAVRLESNLFPPPPPDKKKDNKKAPQETNAQAAGPALPQDVKALIVEQDNTLAAFVANPMFTNPQVVNQDDNAKAHSDLQKLIRLSAALQAEADKLKK